MTTKRMSYALRRLQTQRFGEALRGKFPAKQTTLAAARVTARTVQIGGQYYPGAIDAEAASVINIGRPASAIYGPAGNGGGAVVVLRGGGAAVVGAGGGGGLEPHNLNDTDIHIGQLDRTQATFVATDIAAGIATHAALPDVHHARVSSANTGIAVSGSQALTLTLATSSGLEIASGLKLGTPGNSGAQTSNQVSTSSHTHAIAGYSDGALNPSELVKFDSGGGIAPYYVTTPTINTASGNLTITPAGTGTFTPSAKALGSSVHVPGLLGSGWRISERDGIAGLSHLDIRSIYSDELIVKSFIADIVRVRMGEDWLTYSMGIVTADNDGVNFVTPAVSSSARLYIENSPFVTGELFADNEWVLLDILNRDGGGLVKAYIWGQVSGYIEEADNRQSWLFTNRSGTAGLTVDPGVPALSFGLSGQGYIHRSVVDPDSPFIRVSTWSGANPYTPANRTVHVQLGNLDRVDWSPYFEPSGWGVFADNAYLQGSLVAAAGDVWASTDGLNIQAGNTQGVYGDWPLHLTWTTDPSAPALDNVVFQAWGQRYDATNQGILQVDAGTGTGVDTASLVLRSRRDSGFGAQLTMYAYEAETVVQLFAVNPDDVTKGSIYIDGNISLFGPVVVQGGYVKPDIAGATDLGAAGAPFGTLYVNEVIADTITGSTALGGQFWQYDGDMYIRPTSTSSARTLYVANPGSGPMHLDVEGSITVGGNVDGVDVASFQSDYNAHQADSDAHHNQTHSLASTVALGADHTVSGLSAGHVLKALSGTSAAFGFLAHSQLSSVSANQHHNQNHVLATITGLGPDHSVSGLTAGQVLRATSAGAARFVQLQHDDLGGVTTDQHHAQMHNITGSDHTITGSQYQIVGATAVNTLGLLTPSSNPGAAAAILRTTTSGGLTLKTLTVQGNVDITTGGDLTVGANILFVDASSTNVGINRAPDPQFDLDVNGNMRAGGWIVGKHAIQVANATMIVHFDASDGDKISEQGEPTGHMGQPATEGGDVLYGPGKFGGKALQVSESVTPVATYTFESGTDGFGILSNTTSVAQSGSYAIHGTGALRIEGAGAVNGAAQSPFIIVAANTDYTASVYWRCNYVTQLVIAEYNSSNTLVTTRNAGQIAPDGWQRQTFSFTTSATTAKMKFRLSHYNMPAGQYAYVDAVQLVQSSYSLPFTDQANHTRDYLDYSPAEVINPPKGTVMAWVKPDSINAGNQFVLTTGIDGSSARVYLYINASGNFASAVGGTLANSDTVATAQTWTHLTLTWDGTTARLYADGVEAQNYNYGMVGTVSSTLRIGNNLSSSAAFNGWIDELAILSRAAPASEILAIYESDAPVFAETSTVSFRVGASLVWGDNEGLWTRDTDGTAAFAVVGVDGKSWGGITLDKGDVMIGNAAHGYLQYDRSVGAIKLVDTDLTLLYGNANRNKIKFINGETTVGEIHAYDFGSGAALGIWSYPLDGGSASELFIGTKTLAGAINGYIAILDSNINMLGSVSFGGGHVTVQGANQLRLSSAPLASYGAWAYFRTLSSGGVPTDPTATALVKIDQDSATGAMAALELRQTDDSEEYMFFNGNLGGAHLTTALGSYAGKLRISVNGLAGPFYWIPFYN